MEAFDEDWVEGSGLPTEFGLRPDLTPTKHADYNNRLLNTFQTPDVEGSPSSLRRDDGTTGGGNFVGGGGVTGGGSGGRSTESNNIIKNKTSSPRGRAAIRSNNVVEVYPKGGRSFARSVFAVVRTSIISFFLLMTIMSILFIVIIESDSQMFSHLKHLPEMVILKQEYYDPLKTSVIEAFKR